MTPPVPQIVTFVQPRVLRFGVGAAETLGPILSDLDARRPVVVTSPSNRGTVDRLFATGSVAGVIDNIQREPDFDDCRRVVARCRELDADCVIGLGGGSPMDVAKLAAVLLDPSQSLESCVGIGQIRRRVGKLVCVPTTAGTGSEVSPNAILLDREAMLKKGFISPHLVPDIALIDPQLTVSVSPAVTAATGVDALTHCIEAYTSRFSHPIVDGWALEGIRAIARSLRAAVVDGSDLAARSDVARGSLMGGLCLGPVNTGAVHALAYPLGSRFEIAHGVSNAVLLPHVLRFNLPAAIDRYARIAEAVGVTRSGDDLSLATAGIEAIERLVADCGIPSTLADFGVSRTDIPALADSAMTITRLLERNVRPLTRDDAIAIYERALP